MGTKCPAAAKRSTTGWRPSLDRERARPPSTSRARVVVAVRDVGEGGGDVPRGEALAPARGCALALRDGGPQAVEDLGLALQRARLGVLDLVGELVELVAR